MYKRQGEGAIRVNTVQRLLNTTAMETLQSVGRYTCENRTFASTSGRRVRHGNVPGLQQQQREEDAIHGDTVQLLLQVVRTRHGNAPGLQEEQRAESSICVNTVQLLLYNYCGYAPRPQ